MTHIGCGGVQIHRIRAKARFKRDFRKLDPPLQDLVEKKLKDLMKNPRPSGLGFEKLQGYRKPNINTIHITGNYKLSMEIDGDLAIIRRVGNHDLIDRTP